jgi:hypothetical protein
LNLLKRQIDGRSQVTLAHLKELAARPNSRPDMEIDRMGPIDLRCSIFLGFINA